MRIPLFLILLLVNLELAGQVIIDSDNFRSKLNNIKPTSEIPEGLLSGKSVVIHAYPEAPAKYKKYASELQPGLRKAGIDAVAHYLFDDIFSGIEIASAYRRQLEEREIDFIIYYLQDGPHQLLIKPAVDKLLEGNAYSLINPDLNKLTHNLYLQTAQSGQEKSNLLILEVPGYPDFPKVIQGRRAEFYDLNMKSGKVAIPRTGDSLLDNSIDSIMSAYYPFKYGLVTPGLSEDDLRKEGYWFILYGIHGTGNSVRRLLDYEIKKGENAFASVVADGSQSDVKMIEAKIPVYKFYIKHIQSEDIYLGKHYDAAPTWQEALKNYILNLKNILAP